MEDPGHVHRNAIAPESLPARTPPPTAPAGFSAPAAGLCAVLWGASLCLSLLVAALRLYPAPVGQAALALIGIGFVLFSIARSSLQTRGARPAFSAPLLGPKMRLLYWAGYALMFSGVALTAAASLARFAA